MPATQRPPDSSKPRMLGRYHVLDEIGRDRIYIVHLARLEGPSGFQRWAVVRRVRPELRGIPGFDAAFYDAVRASGRIDSPNVVATHDVGEQEGHLWVAVEYAQGETVEDMLERMRQARNAVPWDVACKIVCDAALGVDGIHSSRDPRGKQQGLLHGHLSPRSLVVTYAGKTKVLDPCVPVIPTDIEASITVTDDMSAVLPYMAPEQVWGDAVDARADVFSLGVVLWEMCAGRRLFMGKTEDETRALLEAGTVPELRATVRGFPGSIDAVIHRAAQREPASRYPHARDLAWALQEATVARGVVVSDEDVGRFMLGLFADLYEEREALLKQAADVTEIFRRSSLDPAKLAPRGASARPAAGAPPSLRAPPAPSRGLAPPRAPETERNFEPAVSGASDEGPTVVFTHDDLAVTGSDEEKTLIRRPESESEPESPPAGRLERAQMLPSHAIPSRRPRVDSDPPRVQIAAHVLEPEPEPRPRFPEVPTAMPAGTVRMAGRGAPAHPQATQQMQPFHPGHPLHAGMGAGQPPNAPPPGYGASGSAQPGMMMPLPPGLPPGAYQVPGAMPTLPPATRGPRLAPAVRVPKGNVVRAIEYVAIGAVISAGAMVAWRFCGRDDPADVAADLTTPSSSPPSTSLPRPSTTPFLGSATPPDPIGANVKTQPTGIASALPKPDVPPTFVGPGITAQKPATARAAPPPPATHRAPPPPPVVEKKPPPVVEKKPPPDPVDTPPPGTAAAGKGLLTVICSPACDQVVDGSTVLGSSPIYKAQVRAGNHHLTLRTSDPPVEKTYDVVVKADDVTIAKIPMLP